MNAISKNSKKDETIFYTLTMIQNLFRIPLKEVKSTLVNQNICYLDGLKIIPYEKYIINGDVKLFDSLYYDTFYFKYKKTFIQSIFKTKNIKELTPMTWKEALKNLLVFSEKVKKKKKKKITIFFMVLMVLKKSMKST